MAVATLTRKGRVTIPKTVRDELRLNAGDKLEFLVDPNGYVLVRPVTKSVDDVFGRLHKPGRKPVTVEEMDSAIKQRMRAAFK